VSSFDGRGQVYLQNLADESCSRGLGSDPDARQPVAALHDVKLGRSCSRSQQRRESSEKLARFRDPLRRAARGVVARRGSELPSSPNCTSFPQIVATRIAAVTHNSGSMSQTKVFSSRRTKEHTQEDQQSASEDRCGRNSVVFHGCVLVVDVSSGCASRPARTIGRSLALPSAKSYGRRTATAKPCRQLEKLNSLSQCATVEMGFPASAGPLA